MRALLIGALAATLTGCACSTPEQTTINGCTPMTGYACPGPAAGKPAAFTVDAPKAKSASAANAQNSPSNQLSKKTRPVPKTPTHNTVGEMKPLPAAQLNHKADPVTEKAKATIAAIMETPRSAEFGEMTRAIKTVLGEPIETICGYVKGKNASGGDTGEMPFVYIVAHNEAYLVDGRSPMADTVYRNLCQ
jgi:hypothetical protein